MKENFSPQARIPGVSTAHNCQDLGHSRPNSLEKFSLNSCHKRSEAQEEMFWGNWILHKRRWD